VNVVELPGGSPQTAVQILGSEGGEVLSRSIAIDGALSCQGQAVCEGPSGGVYVASTTSGDEDALYLSLLKSDGSLAWTRLPLAAQEGVVGPADLQFIASTGGAALCNHSTFCGFDSSGKCLSAFSLVGVPGQDSTVYGWAWSPDHVSVVAELSYIEGGVSYSGLTLLELGAGRKAVWLGDGAAGLNCCAFGPENRLALGGRAVDLPDFRPDESPADFAVGNETQLCPLWNASTAEIEGDWSALPITYNPVFDFSQTPTEFESSDGYAVLLERN
jgi:hypothetical protein